MFGVDSSFFWFTPTAMGDAPQFPGQPVSQPAGGQPGQPGSQPAGGQPGQPISQPAGGQPGQPVSQPAGDMNRIPGGITGKRVYPQMVS